MIKSVTRTLYIDGKPIAEYTQDPMADSELADIEQIAASMELLERPKKPQGRADVGLLSPSILVHLKLSLPKNPFFNRLKRDSN